MDAPEISVVIPLYNVENFVRKCLDSVQSQTFKDFEVLVVDDESTDNSPAIADEFAAADSRFHVIRNHHVGLGGVRNVGLERAKGKYIVFIDSDDFVAPNYLEKLYRACEDNDADMAVCNYTFYFFEQEKHQVRKKHMKDGVITSVEAINLLLRDSELQNYAWNKMYKRSIFMEHNIRYPSICFEDMATTPKYIFYCNRVVGISEALYFYTQREGSIINKNRLNLQKINELMYAASMVKSFLSEIGRFNDFKKSFFYFSWKFCYAAKWFVYIDCQDTNNYKRMFKKFRIVNKNFKYIRTHEDTNLPYQL